MPLFTTLNECDTEKKLLLTFNEGLDNILGGGLPLGCVTELAGQSGSGKTQLCLQFCANVLFPESIGGLDGKAVFLDCEGSFCAERLAQIMDANRVVTKTCTDMDRVFYKRIDSFDELNEALDDLATQLLPTCSDIKLIVLDSIAFHARYLLLSDTRTQMTSFLHTTVQKLNGLAHKFNLAVLVTNQMTTKLDIGLVPALGESWAHACSQWLIVDFDGDSRRRRRKLYMDKSSRSACACSQQNCLFLHNNRRNQRRGADTLLILYL